MRNYEYEFREAVKRTISFGLSDPKILIKEANYIDSKTEELVNFCQKKLPEFTVDQISAQCIKIHYEFKKELELLLDIPIYYTIGYIKIYDNEIFFQSEKSLKEMLDNGNLCTNNIKLHTWLTLPSMEILDFTFPTTYGKVTGNKELYGKTVIIHPNNLEHGMSYHPMIVGDEFLFKIGAIKIEYV